MAVRLDQTTGAGTDPSWLVDRLSLVRLRLRAARYGLRIRFRWSLLEFITFISLPLAILGLILAIPGADHWHPFRQYDRLVAGRSGLSIVIVTVVVGGGFWIIVRYLGQFSSIMRAAAATDRGARMLRNDMDAGMRSPQLYEHLIEIYRPMVDEANAALQRQGYPYALEFIVGPTFNGGQHRYAAVAVAASGSTRLDNLFGQIAKRRSVEFEDFAKTFAESRQHLMRKWREVDGKSEFDDEEGPNYILEEIRVKVDSPEPRLQFEVGVASYGQIMRTCHALVNEYALLSFLLGRRSSPVHRAKSFRRQRLPTAPSDETPTSNPSSVGTKIIRVRPSTALACLPWRTKIHSLAESDASFFLHPLDRAAGIGIALCTLFPMPNGESHVALGIRSDLVGTYPRALHVIPAGMCNTHEMGHVAWQFGTAPRAVHPNYLTSIMRSEFLEEWFNDEELESGRSVEWEERVARKWNGKVKEVQTMVLTGIAYDLLNLRPEVCGVVTVDPFDGSLNSEYRPRMGDVKIALQDVAGPTEIVQSGAAAIILAQEYCSNLLD
jgi:hypothetical protein